MIDYDSYLGKENKTPERRTHNKPLQAYAEIALVEEFNRIVSLMNTKRLPNTRKVTAASVLRQLVIEFNERYKEIV